MILLTERGLDAAKKRLRKIANNDFSAPLEWPEAWEVVHPQFVLALIAEVEASRKREAQS